MDRKIKICDLSLAKKFSRCGQQCYVSGKMDGSGSLAVEKVYHPERCVSFNFLNTIVWGVHNCLQCDVATEKP